MSDSSLVDEGVVVGPVAAETVGGLSKDGLVPHLLSKTEKLKYEDLRMNDCKLNMEVESIFQSSY